MKYVVRAHYVGFYRLHREELARGNLLEGRGVENVIDSVHRIAHRAEIPHISDIEANLVSQIRAMALKKMPHVVLFLFVAREDANLPDLRIKEVAHNGMAETPRSARNEQCLIFVCIHLQSPSGSLSRHNGGHRPTRRRTSDG